MHNDVITIAIVFPLILCIVGALAWALVKNPKSNKAGEYAFVIGLFWLTYLLSNKQLNL